jgi:maltooligosyltrehalose trehalohydrolase
MESVIDTREDMPPAPPGARYLGARRTLFEVWAPNAQSVDLQLVHPFEKTVPMEKSKNGLWRVAAESVEPGSRYLYSLDGKKGLPDPASRFQPEGVTGPSEVVDSDFPWQEKFWTGLPLQDYVIYEMHIGTFTQEGTFDAAIARLPALKDLGVTAVEILPVAQFPGKFNWGYDGTYFYAVQNNYGGPQALKRFVDACHKQGLACVLDVVYNHVGPEGENFATFGPYFSNRYQTPWGPVLNYDGPGSDEVRRYFLQNALFWLEEFRIDALRLDAVNAIVDNSSQPFLQQLGTAVQNFGRRMHRLVYTMGETSSNAPRYVLPKESGGYGLDAQWNFDFHHALHALLTGESAGYLGDHGTLDHLRRAYTDGYVYTGQYSQHLQRAHGASAEHIASRRMIVYAQNHDETGNRPKGERIAQLLPFSAQKLAAAAVLLSPYIPLLWMGEEYGETRPFHFFVDHASAELRASVRAGRRQEARGFGWTEEMVDPFAEAFAASKINWAQRSKGRAGLLLSWYRKLLEIRKRPALAKLDRRALSATPLTDKALLIVREDEKGAHVAALFNFADTSQDISAKLPDGNWNKIIDSSEKKWQGPGAQVPVEFGTAGTDLGCALPAHSVAVLVRSPE